MSGSTIAGSLHILFLYDVGEAIRLDELRRMLGAPAPVRTPPYRQPVPEYVHFAHPPVIEPLPPLTLGDGGSVAGRIAWYDYGVVTVQLEVAFEGGWVDVIRQTSRWMNTAELEQKATAAMRAQVARAAGAIDKPYAEQLSEDYYIVYLRSVRDENGAAVMPGPLIEHCSAFIAQLVRGELAAFSESELAEILESRMSYYENDLLVVGWSAALVYDTPEGAAPTIQLLEYANTQLLEFRHYDGVLTQLLSGVYRSLERGGVLARWRMARDAERLNTIRLDIRELTERVDNSIKFLSDMFAARLYRIAAAKIGVPDYRTLVDQKLESAGELYGFMMDRFYQGRAFLLELMVVIILVIELVFLFRGIH